MQPPGYATLCRQGHVLRGHCRARRCAGGEIFAASVASLELDVQQVCTDYVHGGTRGVDGWTRSAASRHGEEGPNHCFQQAHLACARLSVRATQLICELIWANVRHHRLWDR
jgi:hypothetical protein